MKRLFLFFLMCLPMMVAAQEQNDSIQVVDLNRTFSFGGKAIMCLRSANADKRSLQPLEWTLKNDHIGDNNIVVLDVKNAKTERSVVHQMWSDGVLVRMKTKNGKPEMYEVYDDMFSHLRIVDVGLGKLILFYSEQFKE